MIWYDMILWKIRSLCRDLHRAVAAAAAEAKPNQTKLKAAQARRRSARRRGPVEGHHSVSGYAMIPAPTFNNAVWKIFKSLVFCVCSMKCGSKPWYLNCPRRNSMIYLIFSPKGGFRVISQKWMPTFNNAVAIMHFYMFLCIFIAFDGVFFEGFWKYFFRPARHAGARPRGGALKTYFNKTSKIHQTIQ